MKYSIFGFSQPRAVELGLSSDDLLVLRWFVDFCGTGRMQSIKEKDEIYYWVNYQTVIDDLPILRISKEWLSRKCFKALCNAKILNHKHIKRGGSFSYFGFGENYESLLYIRENNHTENNAEGGEKTPEGKENNTEGVQDSAEGCAENSGRGKENNTEGYVENSRTKINLLNNKSINNNSIKKTNRQSDIEKRFDEFWAAYPKKVGKKAALSSWKKLKPNAELHDRIMTAIGRARVTEQWQKENGRYIPNPTTWINQGRWDDEYEERVTNGVNSQYSSGNKQQPTASAQGASGKQDALAGFKTLEDYDFE